jgi:hypothetical protein
VLFPWNSPQVQGRCFFPGTARKCKAGAFSLELPA